MLKKSILRQESVLEMKTWLGSESDSGQTRGETQGAAAAGYD